MHEYFLLAQELQLARNSWLAPVSVGYRGKDVPLCARFSTKSDLTVNCAFLSSWVHASITFASRCTNRTHSGRHRCDGKLLERTCPRSNCISSCVRFNLDSIWGIHDLGRVRVKEGRYPFRLNECGFPVCALLDIRPL